MPVVELLAEILQVRAPQARGDVPGQGAEAGAGRPAEQQPRAEAYRGEQRQQRAAGQPDAQGPPRAPAGQLLVLGDDADLPGVVPSDDGRVIGVDQPGRLASGAYLVQPAQRHQFQPERQDAAERAVQGSLVEIAGEQGIAVGVSDLKVSECLAAQLAQTTDNGDLVAMRAHRSSRYWPI